jgi:hypothetical protein
MLCVFPTVPLSKYKAIWEIPVTGAKLEFHRSTSQLNSMARVAKLSLIKNKAPLKSVPEISPSSSEKLEPFIMDAFVIFQMVEQIKLL